MLMGKGNLAPSVEIPTASMADISFLLLVFFIVSTSMNQDRGIGMTLPPPGNPMPIPKENIASVWINNRGEVALKYLGQDYITVTLPEMRERIERRIIENPNLVVSLLAQRDADYKTFIDVLDELRMVGSRHDWSKISIAQPFGSAGVGGGPGGQ
ncbi:MAG TPA: biopolymer transporter ExbD [Candidatus Latescibacteria bacterium]|nr:biopolymer transporter ExbD [Candidatus Latescibacterota bacterium]HQE61990.1 biopolymer transporter ExbD [Candidatus Latescibacterota bacterium]HQI74939.1 biopolymer transporter ExbD [Candidatus Latescibacterota bacterium]HQK22259.1 biopolymer transporter ExbD [Candidatus Latescibacterota bacterium]